MDHNLQIVLILTIGLTLASVLGYLMLRIKFSPILGYLIAGYMIGPYFPSFTADMHLAEQLAEVGVVLMLFGVGMHFKIKDLMNVKKVAIPGAIGQTIMTSIIGGFSVYQLGWNIESGIIVGLAISVASTVVLVRVLTDNQLLETIQGHIAVGWLIVEDVFTVIVLIMLPLLPSVLKEESFSLSMIANNLFIILLKFALLVVLMFTVGQKLVNIGLKAIARVRSQELFTLSVFSLIFMIAAGSTLIFGVSIALGAFIAGMVIARSDTSHQAFMHSLPLKYVFSVVFFLSVGMLFNPAAILEHFPTFATVLAVILIVKPLSAFLIVLQFKLPINTALVVALSLAQIGEFSFILAEEAMNLKILPDSAYDILVACAIVSISINPLLFSLLKHLGAKWKKENIKNTLKTKILSGLSQEMAGEYCSEQDAKQKVIVIGFGFIGQTAVNILSTQNMTPLVIEYDINIVEDLKLRKNMNIIYGDATNPNILEWAHIEKSKILIITVSEITTTTTIIKYSLELNPHIHILARIASCSEKKLMDDMGIECICSELEESLAFQNAIKKFAVNTP